MKALFKSISFILVVSFVFHLFPSVQAAPDIPVTPCAPAQVPANAPYISEAPSYDYGEDGLVKFHYNLKSGWWAFPIVSVKFYNASCNFTHESEVVWSVQSWSPLRNTDRSFTYQIVPALELGRYFFEFRDDSIPTPWFGALQGTFSLSEIQNISIGIKFTQEEGVRSLNYDYARTAAVPIRQGINPPARTPVLIVPGIMGTELWNGTDHIWPDLDEMAVDVNDNFLFENLKLDSSGKSVNGISTIEAIEKIFDVPLLNVNIFEGLRQGLEQQGYSLNSDIFYFPYDWRIDLNETKEKLAQKIDAIKEQTGSAKVDIVAHSMGGLLTKAYLNSYGKDSVNKLIFVGTPHLGAPKAGKVLLEGDRFDISWLEEEAVKQLAQNLPALYELLPNSKYFDISSGYISKYQSNGVAPLLTYEQTKSFLVNDNGKNSTVYEMAENFFEQNLQDYDLSGIDVYNIAGCKSPTQAGYYFGPDNNSIARIGFTSGDKTVPLVSSYYVNIPDTKKFYVKDANHSELPSMSGPRQLIVGILTGNIQLESNVSQTSDFCNFKGKTLTWRSPVEVHIYDQQGRHTGPIANNAIEFGIPGVSYAILDGEKFVFLPTDEGQVYDIQGIGEAQGTFDLLISKNDNGSTGSTFVYNDLGISTGTPVSFSVSENTPDNQIWVNNLVTQPQAQIFGDDLVPPTTLATATGTPGNNGWFKSDARVGLLASDDLSGVLETYYRTYTTNGTNRTYTTNKTYTSNASYKTYTTYMSDASNMSYKTYSEPISITGDGTQYIEYYSVDKAGNNEAVKTLEIKIDKTAPGFSAQFSLDENDFVVQATDGTTTIASQCTQAQCIATDPAGNTSKLTFQKNKLLTLRSILFKKIEQNGAALSFPDNLFIVNNFTTKNTLKDFNQTVLIKNQEIGRVDYEKKKNQSLIFELTKQGLKKSTLPGIHFLKITTNKNTLLTSVW